MISFVLPSVGLNAKGNLIESAKEAGGAVGLI